VTPEPAPGQADDAQALRAALRHGLITALKARDTDAVAALRTTIAAIDNAQAVPASAPTPTPTVASAHVAGARSGAGSTEAARRQLGRSELRDILRGQVTEHAREADRYDALGQSEAAARLRRRARALAAYLH
jgi:hypothetical protein